jgi:hypothetical protein
VDVKKVPRGAAYAKRDAHVQTVVAAHAIDL